jgi:ketosteroid isomerase-like protein
MSEYDRIAHNLAIVDAHFEAEAKQHIEPVLDLYTDDVVWEAPARRLVLHGRESIAENYRASFASMSDVTVEPVRRFGGADRVVDECNMSFRLINSGMVNAPLPSGAELQMRLLHIFEMRDGRIARESAYEIWPEQPQRRAPDAETAEGDGCARIMQLGLGFWGAKALLSAVELGLFTELALRPLTAPALAERLGLHPRGHRDWLDALVALGMLQRHGELYSNSHEAQLLLDRESPSYLGGMLEMANNRLYRFWGFLTDALRTGEPQNEIRNGGAAFFDALYSEPARLRGFLQAMTGLSLGAARAIAAKFPWERYATFMDIGGAQGGLPVQVALAHEHLTGGNFDLPAVRPIFEEYVKSQGLGGRLHFQPGNFFLDALPAADVLVMGHILHDWNLDEKKLLLRKAYDALPEGGALIVYEALIDDERRQNAFGLLMSLNMLVETPGGFDYTGAECTAWMRAAGFRDTWVERLVGPDSMVVAIK